jgi:hypothetical protein
MVVGTDGLSAIANGSQLRLHLDGRVEVVAEAGMAGRTAAA